MQLTYMYYYICLRHKVISLFEILMILYINHKHLEIKNIFQTLPLMAAMTIEIPNPGDYKSLEITGVPILVTRCKDGKVNAFRNVCTHRGAIITEPGIGNKSRFSCPYHGWTYSNNGDLIGVTDKEKFGDFDSSCHGLSKLPCKESVSYTHLTLPTSDLV